MHGHDRPHYTNVIMPFPNPPPSVPEQNPTGLYRTTLTVPAGTFRTVLIVDHERGRGPTGYDGTHYYWVDRNTGLPVKRRTESSSPGKTSDWEMTSLRVPQ